MSPETARRMKAERRKYLREISTTTRSILQHCGRPLTVYEIYEQHPERRNISQDVLYHTLYKRQYQKQDLIFRDGYFWLIDENFPSGWEHLGSSSATG